ncbi:type II secretion system F family protein [Pseudophaeobacter sp.]|uniref:type II secretion system F family protein n=1 Tax=Pseudophaeobacter sp. TaxID=1971739 RepID=UPI00329A0264
MVAFSYSAFNATGKKEKGRVEAATEQRALDILKSRCLTVSYIGEATDLTFEKPWYARDISFSGGLLSLREQAAIARFIAVLFEARLSLLEVLHAIQNTTENDTIRAHFGNIAMHVSDGEKIDAAFEAERPIFSPIFYGFLRSSDAANALPSLMHALADQFDQQAKARDDVVSALIYPTILVIASIVLVLVVVLVLVPSLVPIFENYEQEPSFTIGILIQVNATLRGFWIPLTIGFTAIGFTGFALVLSGGLQKMLPSVVARLPIVRGLVLRSQLAQLCRSCQLLLEAGEPLPTALRLSSDALGAKGHLGRIWNEAAELVEAGQRASVVFSNYSFLPRNFLELFRIGEEANRLPETLKASADTLAIETTTETQRLVKLVTPVLTLVMGVGIGALIYTIMGAIMEVNEIAF